MSTTTFSLAGGTLQRTSAAPNIRAGDAQLHNVQFTYAQSPSETIAATAVFHSRALYQQTTIASVLLADPTALCDIPAEVISQVGKTVTVSLVLVNAETGESETSNECVLCPSVQASTAVGANTPKSPPLATPSVYAQWVQQTAQYASSVHQGIAIAAEQIEQAQQANETSQETIEQTEALLEDANAQVAQAAAYASEAAQHAGLAEEQVALAAAQVEQAQAQVTLAGTAGAQQVALAAAQVTEAEAQVTLATAQAALATQEAQTAASAATAAQAAQAAAESAAYDDTALQAAELGFDASSLTLYRRGISNTENTTFTDHMSCQIVIGEDTLATDTMAVLGARFYLGKMADLRSEHYNLVAQLWNNGEDSTIFDGMYWCFSSSAWIDWNTAIAGIVCGTLSQSDWSSDKETLCTTLAAAGFSDDHDVYLGVLNQGIYNLPANTPADFEFRAFLYDNRCINNMIPMALQESIAQNSTAITQNSSNIAQLNETVSAYTPSANYITCWGDSLTADGGWTSALSTALGIPVYNAGAGGESARTILARQGGDAIMLNGITVPANQEYVQLATYTEGLNTQLGNTVSPLLQGGSWHINPCYLADTECTLEWTGDAYNDTTGVWRIKQNADGDAITIDRPTALMTNCDKHYNASYMIIFMGQNGGYDDVAQLVQYHKYMIAHSNAKKTLILGLSSGTENSRAEYETAMRDAFGRYFISLREYLASPIYNSDGEISSCYGLADQNLAPTETDLAQIAVGQVPDSCLSDSVHFTDGTKTAIGTMLVRKWKELGMS